MSEATIHMDTLQREHENEWVALDSDTKEVLASNISLHALMEELEAEKHEAEPLFFKVPTNDASLSPTGYEV